MAWVPLIGRSTADIFEQHSDPLAALQRADIPAIVVRNLIDEAEAQELSARLMRTNFHVENPTYSTMGPDLHKFLQVATRWTPGRFTQRIADALTSDYLHQSASHARKLEIDGLSRPVEKLHRTLAQLHAREPDGAVVERRVNGSMLSPGIFRRQLKGNHFTPHADTLHSAKWKGTCRNAKSSPSDRLYGHMFTPMSKFEQQFSAVFVLQPSIANSTQGHVHARRQGSSSSLHLFDADWRELMKDCDRHPAAISYDVGVRFLEWERHRPQLQQAVRSYNLSAGAGDFYIFNSNRVHEVMPILEDGLPRVTFGTFVGYSATELAVWS